jgi:hypothetical protein
MKWQETEEKCIIRSFIITSLIFTKYYYDDEIVKDEIGGAYSTHVAKKRKRILVDRTARKQGRIKGFVGPR